MTTLPCASLAASSATRSTATVSGEASQLAENVSGGICRLVDSNCSLPSAISFSTITVRINGNTALDHHMVDSHDRRARMQAHQRQPAGWTAAHIISRSCAEGDNQKFRQIVHQ